MPERGVRHAIATRERRSVKCPGHQQQWAKSFESGATRKRQYLVSRLSVSCHTRRASKMKSFHSPLQAQPARDCHLPRKTETEDEYCHTCDVFFRRVAVDRRQPFMHSEAPQPKAEITQLLQAWRAGDRTALDDLLPFVQSELHALAAHYMRRQSADHVLQATALVNEVWLKLIGWQAAPWQSRAQFFGVAAHLMRRILVDEARRQQAAKHGGQALRVSLTDATARARPKPPEVLALDDALEALAQFDKRRSRLVELRFFGGLSIAETAEVLNISPRTVAREWQLAQAWLYREMKKS